MQLAAMAPGGLADATSATVLVSTLAAARHNAGQPVVAGQVGHTLAGARQPEAPGTLAALAVATRVGAGAAAGAAGQVLGVRVVAAVRAVARVGAERQRLAAVTVAALHGAKFKALEIH
jgi:hypothetical protein